MAKPGRPRTSDGPTRDDEELEPLSGGFSLRIPQVILDGVEDYWHATRRRARTEAMRILIEEGLKRWGPSGKKLPELPPELAEAEPAPRAPFRMTPSMRAGLMWFVEQGQAVTMTETIARLLWAGVELHRKKEERRHDRAGAE